jgi:hypothetical protein
LRASNRELQTELLAVLSPALASRGFVWKSGLSSYVRSADGISHGYMIVFKDAKPGVLIEPNVGVRIDEVERIFHHTSGFDPKFHRGTTTMGASVGQLIANSTRACQFELRSSAELPGTALHILDVFEAHALPYFARWDSLEAIDAELNEDPLRKSPHRALSSLRCATGLIVARLLGRTNYAELSAQYTTVMTNDSKGFYLKEFLALLDSLESIPLGRGLTRPS